MCACLRDANYTALFLQRLNAYNQYGLPRLMPSGSSNSVIRLRFVTFRSVVVGYLFLKYTYIYIVCVRVCVMGKKRYDMLLEVLEEFNGSILHVGEIMRLLSIEIGGDQRTIKGYMQMATDLAIIKEVEHLKFRVDTNNNFVQKLKAKIK